MLLTFRGMVISQRPYKAKDGSDGCGITFVEVPSGKQFQVSGPIVVEETAVFKVTDWTIQGTLANGNKGLYFRTEKITGGKV